MTQRKGVSTTGTAWYYSTVYSETVFDNMNVPVMHINNVNMLDHALKYCDALVVPGGADVIPSYYGEQQLHPKTYFIDNKNDELDFAAIKAFHEAGKPILGICRGIQVINVYFGGTLYQHIDHHDLDKNDDMHLIFAEKDGFVYDCYKRENVMVNSYHHQAIKDLAKGFKICAKSPDGIIEAISRDNIYAVQWHPEMIEDMVFFEYINRCLINRGDPNA